MTATHPDYGKEWWITDGTEAGTKMLADATPGSASSTIGWRSASETHFYFSIGDVMSC